MKIETQEDVDHANRRFNHFHDGFIKRIIVTSDSEFATHDPWEERPQFASPEEELAAAGLCLRNDTEVKLEVHHYNYDCPNQPLRRAILIRAPSATPADMLLSFVGREIFDLSFARDASGIACLLTHHTADAGPVRSMANGVTTPLFRSEKMEIEETEWAEPPSGA